MIKNTLKIYFKNFIYLFVAMGIIYLFTLITLFMYAALTLESVQTMLNDSAAFIQAATGDSGNSIKEFMDYAISQLDTSGNIFDIVGRIIETNWIQTTAEGFFATLNLSVEGFSEGLNEIIYAFTATMAGGFAAAVTLIVLGVICASYATRYVLRRKNAKRGVKKFLIATIIEPMFIAAISVVALLILGALQAFAILAYIGMTVVLAVIALASSWIIHRDATMKFSEVVNAKNVLLYAASLLILFAIFVVFAVALFLLNALLAILIIVPLAVYTLAVTGVFTDSFVCEMIKEKYVTP